MLENLKITDPEIFDLVKKELERQRDGVQLISAENHTSTAVIEAAGTWLTNKYSEGYPGRKYYGGNQFCEEIERIAIRRAKELFGSKYANVQSHSGSSANISAYFAFMEHGDKFMSLALPNGGHLTHGSPVNFSGKWFKPVFYDLDPETQMLDYDEIRKMAIREKPKILLSGFTIYPREVKFKIFREIADEVGAVMMTDISHIAGLCAAGIHENPVPYSDVITSTTHKTLRGPRGAIILSNEKENAIKIKKAVFPGTQGGPLDHIIAAKAVSFGEALKPEFKTYQQQIVKNAQALAQTLTEGGFELVTGGTDTHTMFGSTVKSFGLSGKQVQDLLETTNIYVNMNMVPFDNRKPMDPGGIRVGVPPVTSRGMKQSEMKLIGELMIKVLKNPENDSIKKSVKEQIKELCEQFQLYPEIRL